MLHRWHSASSSSPLAASAGPPGTAVAPPRRSAPRRQPPRPRRQWRSATPSGDRHRGGHERLAADADVTLQRSPMAVGWSADPAPRSRALTALREAVWKSTAGGQEPGRQADEHHLRQGPGVTATLPLLRRRCWLAGCFRPRLRRAVGVSVRPRSARAVASRSGVGVAGHRAGSGAAAPAARAVGWCSAPGWGR